MLVWDEAYSTGFPEIDDQHKKLFQVINRLGKRIKEGKGEEELEPILIFLEEYAKIHFGYEEECMAAHKCPVAQENKNAHQRFVAGYHSYRERYHRLGASRELVEDIHKECERWLTNHIGRIDTHLKACAQKKKTL